MGEGKGERERGGKEGKGSLGEREKGRGEEGERKGKGREQSGGKDLCSSDILLGKALAGYNLIRTTLLEKSVNFTVACGVNLYALLP